MGRSFGNRSAALLAGCSAGLSAHPSDQFVEGGAHPDRLTAPTLAPSTTLPPTTTTAPRKHIPTTTTTTSPPPPPPPTSPPTTRPIIIQTTTTTAAPQPKISTPQPAIGNPSVGMAPDPNFYGACPDNSLDLSGACEEEALQAIDHARASEGLGPMELPSDWSGLTGAEQLFVATNLERTAAALLLTKAWQRCSSLRLSRRQTAAQTPCRRAVFPLTSGRATRGTATPIPLKPCMYGCMTTVRARRTQIASPAIRAAAGGTAKTSLRASHALLAWWAPQTAPTRRGQSSWRRPLDHPN